MKTITKVLTVISLAILYSCSGTQSLTKDGTPIPYNVNTIIVQDDKEIDASYKSFAQHLLQDGYSIKYSDETLHTLTTSYKNASKKGTDISTDVSISAAFFEDGESTKIIIRGTGKQGFIIGGADLGILTISHTGMSGSLARVAWDEMLSISQSYSSELLFEIR